MYALVSVIDYDISSMILLIHVHVISIDANHIMVSRLLKWSSILNECCRFTLYTLCAFLLYIYIIYHLPRLIVRPSCFTIVNSLHETKLCIFVINNINICFTSQPSVSLHGFAELQTVSRDLLHDHHAFFRADLVVVLTTALNNAVRGDFPNLTVNIMS